jgi:hypothetical protein
VIATSEMIDLPRALVGPLRPCPFCGAAPRVERNPWLDESVRIACGNEACGVRPRTEYLLLRFAGELRDAWNARPEADGGRTPFPGDDDA